jgi:hypothetical protein
MAQSVRFCNPETGNLADFTGQVHDTSWNFFAPYVSILPTTQTTTGWKARLTADVNTTVATEPTHVRIHGSGFPLGTDPAYYNQGQFAYLSRSFAMATGSTWNNPVTIDEVHGGPLAAGPAPLNGEMTVGGYHREYIRGGTSNSTFDKQKILGPDDGSGSNSTYSHQDWAGGNKLVVLGERMDLIYGFYFDTQLGQFALWARWGGATAYTNVVPWITNIPTCYPDFGGPYLSFYSDRTGGSGTGYVDIFEGHWSDTLAQAMLVQGQQLVTAGGGSGIVHSASATSNSLQIVATQNSHTGTAVSNQVQIVGVDATPPVTPPTTPPVIDLSDPSHPLYPRTLRSIYRRRRQP